MGLSGPRKRAKFSHDPNNTTWSRSESKYGQRILQAQGWKPGDYLGAENARHAKYHTVANSSHIKVALREENLGVGARVGAAGGEWGTTGLDSFQDLLGRLNGKSEKEIEQVQKGREVLKRNHYVESRWGTLRFVSGGLLVGDRVEESKHHRDLEELHQKKSESAAEIAIQLVPVQDEQSVEGSNSKPKKKSRKSKRREDDDRSQPEETIETAPTPAALDQDNEAQKRAAKAERKVLRQQRREARHIERSQVVVKQPAPLLVDQVMTVEPDASVEAAAPNALRSGIQMVRQRHIQQKRMAMMDSKAMKEILMINT